MTVSNHANYLGNKAEYTYGYCTVTTTREVQEEPTATDSKATYKSREAMLQAELTSRTDRSVKAKMKHVAYSDLPRYDIDAEIQIHENMDLFGLKKDDTLKFKNEYFHHSSLNGKTYKDADENIHTVHNAVASSWDRSSEDLMMARVLKDGKEKPICYAGRPDNQKKATQLAEDIFRTEKSKLPLDRDGRYILTFVVDSLTNGGSLQNPGLLNERTSLIEENDALNNLDGKTISIDDCQVVLHPIHVHHTLSFWNRFAPVLPDTVTGIATENAINTVSYTKLTDIGEKLIKDGSLSDKKKEVLEGAIYHLNQGNLPVHERLMLVDLICKICDLPVVHHCKSVVDRTSIAKGISMINHLINEKLEEEEEFAWERDEKGRIAPHLLCRKEEYKKYFAATLAIQHQVSKDARIAIMPDGTIEGRKTLGLNYHDDTFGTVPCALSLLPEEALKDTWFQGKTKTATLVLGSLLAAAMVVTGLYHTIVLAATIYFSIKSGAWQGEFGKELALLPIRINWLRLGEIDASKNFNFDHEIINGNERALLVGAKTTHMQKNKAVEDKEKEPLLGSHKDPRLVVIPPHLHPKTD